MHWACISCIPNSHWMLLEPKSRKAVWTSVDLYARIRPKLQIQSILVPTRACSYHDVKMELSNTDLGSINACWSRKQLETSWICLPEMNRGNDDIKFSKIHFFRLADADSALLDNLLSCEMQHSQAKQTETWRNTSSARRPCRHEVGSQAPIGSCPPH